MDKIGKKMGERQYRGCSYNSGVRNPLLIVVSFYVHFLGPFLKLYIQLNNSTISDTGHIIDLFHVCGGCIKN